MSTDLDATRIVRSWLRTDEHESADRVLDDVLALLDATPQHRAQWPVRRFADMNSYAKLAIAAAAVVAVALVGISFLPRGSSVVGGAAPTASPSPSPSPSALPSSSQSPRTAVWPIGALRDQRYEALTPADVLISFRPPSTLWRGSPDALETGQFPNASYAWMVFTNDIGDVATDPCRGKSKAVDGSSIDDLAAALATIPGLTAKEPMDATIAGHPAKLVELTVDSDPPCPMNQFWLYGQTSLYPNTVDSTIRLWITEVAGKRFVIHTDQAGDNPQVEHEIQQIIDS
ncbi:MAG TPA: hypothetical protein VFN41_07505, partial [Candidatus Limnocylindrales bacterium]|nr:hypothetical protein [Candidatus Limnocylindrales bacterium]